MWPPSRPSAAGTRGAGPRPQLGEDPLAVSAVELLRATARTLTARMVAEVDEVTLAVLVDFLESAQPGAVVLAREGGRIVVAEAGSGSESDPRRAVG